MDERKAWHGILQEMLEDPGNLQVLSGKIIAGKAREYHQLIRADFICHTKGAVPEGRLKPIIRPFDHFKRRNLLEYKSTWEVVNEKTFRRYIGRVLDAETCDDIDYQGETTLTILTSHKPEALLAKPEYKIEPINSWKYQSRVIPHLDIFILVQREMRGLKEGEALALLQIIESDKEKQKFSWQSILEQDLDNKDVVRKIIEKINKENFMSLVEELKVEGKVEGKREIALEMLKDGMGIPQVVKFTKLSEAEILKLKKQLEAKK